jgi:GNAT superfamily N-acetyltransferase
MTEDFRIEQVNEDNFEDFIYLVEKLAEFEKLTPPDEDSKGRLKKDGLAEDPKYEAFIGILDGKPIAYLIYFFNYSSFLALPTLYLEDIFVLEDYRRRGLGTKLFRFCVEQAMERGCGRIELCVLTWNESAIKFYEKTGAKRLDWYFYRLDKNQLENYLTF